MAERWKGKLAAINIRPKWPEDDSNLTIVLIRVTTAQTKLGIGNDD